MNATNKYGRDADGKQMPRQRTPEQAIKACEREAQAAEKTGDTELWRRKTAEARQLQVTYGLPIERPEWIHNCGLATEKARALGKHLSTANEFFVREKNRGVMVVESERLVSLSPHMLVTRLEEYVTPTKVKVTKSETEEKIEQIELHVPESANPGLLHIILESREFAHELPRIDRVLDYSMPFMTGGEVRLPGSGYDSDLKTWVNPNGPKVSCELSIEEARETILSLYEEFCFRRDSGKPVGSGYDNPMDVNKGLPYSEVVAIAHLFTPFCRGLLERTTSLVPSFIYRANRPRAGKDHCAEIPALVHAGIKCNKGPATSRPEEELRKQLTALLMEGARLIHYPNNRGRLDSAVLEAVITDENPGDRVLGSSEGVCLPNEMVISFSMNECELSTDLINRSLECNLEYFDIDANSRSFRGDPHTLIATMQGRERVLGALASCVKHWSENGMPHGKTVRTSQRSWAEIVGGIMVSCGLGDPCAPFVTAAEKDEMGRQAEEFLAWLWRGGVIGQSAAITFQVLRDRLGNASIEDRPFAGFFDLPADWQRMSKHIRQSLKDRLYHVSPEDETFVARLRIDDGNHNRRFHRIFVEEAQD